MPTIPIYTTDENGVPLNDLELYVDGVLVDGDLDYGDTYSFPCGSPFKMELRRTLWYGANEVICHNNPVQSNNDEVFIIPGFATFPFSCLFPITSHTPFSSITVTINGTPYTVTYNYYTPTVNQMLNDVAVLINANTATTFWEAIVEGDCLRIRKTQYTANSFNGQVYTITIHREFSPVTLITNLGPTGNTTFNPCVPISSSVDGNEYSWEIRYREVHEDFTQTITVDSDDDVPFVFENTLEFPCCQNWSVNNNDNDGILEAGEFDPMYIILATPDFDGAISNFYLVKHPCSNRVCAYEMTNIPYCIYEYNFNVTPEGDEKIIYNSRNVCHNYLCADIYTIGLRVIRCSEEVEEYLSICGCGIDEVPIYAWIEDVSYQQVETDLLKPSIVDLTIDRPTVCDILCEECHTYCKVYCYQEEDNIELRYVWDYPCCDTHPNAAIIDVYINNVLAGTHLVVSGNVVSFSYTWSTTGLQEIRLAVNTCCGTYEYKYKIYVVPCKAYDLDFDWRIDCDCKLWDNQNRVRECDCVPVGEEVMFYPQYTVPDCGCPITCEEIDQDPIITDIFTEQDNGDRISSSNLAKFVTLPVMIMPPQNIHVIINNPILNGLTVPSILNVPTHTAIQGTGVRFILNRNTSPFLSVSPLVFRYSFQNVYNLSGYTSAVLSFKVQFRYENIPDAPYPPFGMPPEFPFKRINFHGLENFLATTNTVTPSTAHSVQFSGSYSNYYSPSGALISPFRTSSTSPPPQEPFTNPAIIAYQIDLTFNPPPSNLSGIELAMDADPLLYINNQYIVGVLISDIDLVVTQNLPPIERCYKEYIVRWYVDDEKVKEVTMKSPNYDLVDDRLEYVFPNKGCYEVKLEVENCAGACSVEKQLCAGDSITLTKVDCYEWQISDCKRYRKCYTDCAEPNVLSCEMNIAELNIVVLPIDTEWVQLEPDTVYYDPREDKWFVYWKQPLAIIQYAQLYDTTAAHASGLFMLEYPYMTNIATGAKYWICEKYKAVVEVWDIKGNLLEGYPYEVLYYEGHTIDISVPKDGIYKVRIQIFSLRPDRYSNGTTLEETTENVNTIVELECEYEWYLIELCGIYKCYETLFQKLQCAADCECPNEKEIKRLRQELNLFMAFFNLLNISVEAEFSMYATMSSIIMDSQRIANAETIQEQLEALIKLCNKCGCACKTDYPKKPSCKERILAQNTTVNYKNDCGCSKK
ncbi:MAG: hypothetical protein RML94_00055 [Bacteroidia bacterium]|nr:hypothetical protein [Bacteroidia bacterium]